MLKSLSLYWNISCLLLSGVQIKKVVYGQDVYFQNLLQSKIKCAPIARHVTSYWRAAKTWYAYLAVTCSIPTALHSGFAPKRIVPNVGLQLMRKHPGLLIYFQTWMSNISNQRLQMSNWKIFYTEPQRECFWPKLGAAHTSSSRTIV